MFLFLKLSRCAADPNGNGVADTWAGVGRGAGWEGKLAGTSQGMAGEVPLWLPATHLPAQDSFLRENRSLGE